MLADPTQLPAPVVIKANVDALLSEASASSETLQAEVILVLTCKAQSSTVLRLARNGKRYEEQAGRCESNRCQVTHSNFPSARMEVRFRASRLGPPTKGRARDANTIRGPKTFRLKQNISTTPNIGHRGLENAVTWITVRFERAGVLRGRAFSPPSRACARLSAGGGFPAPEKGPIAVHHWRRA